MRRLLTFLNSYRILLLVLALLLAQVGTWLAVLSVDRRLDSVHDTIIHNSCGGGRMYGTPCRVTIVTP
jgi:hypothetical protein